jgi:hypothetical protein
MLAKVAQGNPPVVAIPVTWTVYLVGQQPAVANAAFGTVQLALGLGIAWRPTVKAALAGPIGWALAVWWLGEGFGGLLAGTASPVSGGPGPVLLYAVLAVLRQPAGSLLLAAVFTPGRRRPARLRPARRPPPAAACWAAGWPRAAMPNQATAGAMLGGTGAEGVAGHVPTLEPPAGGGSSLRSG